MQILVYWKPQTYSEFRESLEYSLHRIFCNTAILELEAYSEPYQISLMENFVQNVV